VMFSPCNSCLWNLGEKGTVFLGMERPGTIAAFSICYSFDIRGYLGNLYVRLLHQNRHIRQPVALLRPGQTFNWLF